MLVMAFLLFVLFLLREFYGKNIFFTIIRYIFIAGYFVVVYAAGGPTSPISIVLLYPMLVAMIDLNPREIKIVGFVVVTVFAGMILLNPEKLSSPGEITLHLVMVFLLADIAYYIYKIVNETLRQKYEKEEAKRRFVELIELDKVKSDFISVVSNRLQNPLSGAMWAIDNAMKNENVSKAGQMILQDSFNKVKGSMEIIQEMLDTVEFDVPGFALKFVSIDLNILTEDILEDLKYMASFKNVEVVFIKAEPAIFVSGDEKKFRIVLFSVIDNSIRYSPGGRVKISIERTPNGVDIFVKDTGVGIDAEDLPYVFERLYRGKEAIKIEPNETGVGLYTAKKIIELHKGKIDLASVKGQGTTVTISLPTIG